jgi:hypothetical protein
MCGLVALTGAPLFMAVAARHLGNFILALELELMEYQKPLLAEARYVSGLSMKTALRWHTRTLLVRTNPA